MRRLLSSFLFILAAVALVPAGRAQVTGFSIVKPNAAPNAVLTLPGSVRRIALRCATGCSVSQVAAWTVGATTGGASATLKPSGSGNYVDVQLGATGGSCPVAGAQGAYSIAATAAVIVKATSSDSPTVSDTIVFDVCKPAVEAYTVPFYRVLYSGQAEDIQGVVWGSSNTDGNWQIVQQPSGGDGVLDDTTYHDAVFHATVKGLYKVRWIAAVDSSKTSDSTFYVTGNAQPRLAQPNGTQPIDCTVDPNTTGGVIDVGPLHAYKNLEAVTQGMMKAGATIRLFNDDTTGKNPTTYHEWIQINGRGTHDAPIRLCGVADAAGNLPVMDGVGATARADVLSPAYVSGLAGIFVYAENYDSYPSYTGPQYVIVEGIALRNYGPQNQLYTAGSTTTTKTYDVGSSGFRFQKCRDCEFNGSEVSLSGNGVFAESNDAANWGGVTERLLFEGNNVHDNGVKGDTHEHNWYLQAWFQVVQFNQMPTYNTAAQGSQYKDRGISWFRYNLVGTGAARSMDMVEDQDSDAFLGPIEYLAGAGAGAAGTAYDGAQLAAAQEAWHHSAFVYGNIFQQANAGSIHFASDVTGGDTLRTGSLEFYNNSINALASAVPGGQWRYNWFDTGDNGNNAPHFEWPTINAGNLAIAGFTSAKNPYFYWNSQRDAFINFGRVLLPTAWGTNAQSCTNNTTGACDGTGWPYQSNTDVYFSGNAFNVTGVENFITFAQSTPWDSTTFQLGAAISGLPLTGAQAALPVRFQYVPGKGYAARRTVVVNDRVGGQIGATDAPAYTAIYLPPVANVGGPYSGVTGTAVAFNGAASSDPKQEALTYAWSFGDGSTATGATASHSYATAGSYTVSLTVTNADHLTATQTAVVTVAVVVLAPTASAGGPYTVKPGIALAFNGSGSTDPKGQALTYAWSFGDGTTAPVVSPSHTYPVAGTYTVTLTVVNKDGAKSTQWTTASVTSKPPVAVSLKLNSTSFTLPVSSSTTITCSTVMSDGTTHDCIAPVLTASNAASVSVVYVWVKSTATPGSGVITVTAEGLTATTAFTILGPAPKPPVPVALTLNYTAYTLPTLSSFTVTCTTTMSDGTAHACIAPVLTTNNTASTIVSYVWVKSTAVPGQAVITVAAEGLKTAITFFVKDPLPVVTAGK